MPISVCATKLIALTVDAFIFPISIPSWINICINMYWYSSSLLHNFASKSTLLNIRIAMQAWFWLSFVWCIHVHLFNANGSSFQMRSVTVCPVLSDIRHFMLRLLVADVPYPLIPFVVDWITVMFFLTSWSQGFSWLLWWISPSLSFGHLARLWHICT